MRRSSAPPRWCPARSTRPPSPSASIFVNSGAGGIDNSCGQFDAANGPGGRAYATRYFAQTNWNNFSPVWQRHVYAEQTASGRPYSFNLQWDSGYSDTTGTAAGLGTPDGKLMDGFMSTWGPGAATPLANSVYDSAINNKPLVYISGLNAWYTAEGAEGYGVVLYTTGYSYYETAEGYIESVTGSPLDNTMVEGPILTPICLHRITTYFRELTLQPPAQVPARRPRCQLHVFQRVDQ